MNVTDLIPYIAIALIGVAFSALFSGAEMGVYTLNRVRLAVRSGQGDSRARLLRREIAHPNRLLGTLLIGNNIANYAGSLGIAAILEAAGLSDWRAIALNAVLLTPVLFIFGETLPKDLFRTNSDRWTYHVAPLLVFIRWVFTLTLLLPMVQAVGLIAGRWLHVDMSRPLAARERIALLIKEGVGAGVLSEPQLALADRALAMRSRTVENEMVPWSRVITIRIDTPLQKRQDILRRTRFTRLPVIDANGHVVGILATMDAVIDPDKPTAALMHERHDLPVDVPVVAALRLMRERKRKFAIATDSATGEVRGIVTLKDLVEPLTGELGAW